MENLRFGSVCSGIEAASVAWEPLGWKAAWFAEIEPFPCAVLAHHYPNVPNLGDMSKLPGRVLSGEIEAPDVFCGGTPCQAFSVAGLRRSLDDARGNLSLVFCEIANAIDSVRSARGEQPSIIFWENVPGVLSTADNAFGCFLAGLAGEDDPLVAPGGKWTNAGVVLGPKRAIAWRVTDAQYFGVAQRRRRVFVVASARDGFDPAAVLFESESVRRDTPPSREAGEGFTRATAPCLTSSGRGVERTGDTRGQDPVVGCWWDGGQVSQTLDAVLSKGQTMPEKNRFPAVLQPVAHVDACNHEDPIAVYAIQAGALRTNPASGPDGIGVQEGHAYTLEARAEVQAVCCVSGDISHTLTAPKGGICSEDGTGRCPPTIVVVQGTQDPCVSTTTAFALGRNNGGENAVLSVSLRGREGGATAELGDEVGNCLRASGGGGDKAHVLAPVAFTVGNLARCAGPSPSSDTFPTLTVSKGCGLSDQQPSVMTAAMAVRRLTPVECERLQGFPDNWTLIPWRKKPAEECPDGPRYKALGNSWAVPNVRWIGRRIQRHLAGEL